MGISVGDEDKQTAPSSSRDFSDASTSHASRADSGTASISGGDYFRSFRSNSTLGSGSLNSSFRNTTHQPRRTSRLSAGSNAAFNELNSLKFSSLGLYGRESELDALHQAFRRLGKKTGDNKKHQAPPSSNLVTIRGRSGTGKSALVKAFGSRLQGNDKSVLFVSGKFEQHHSVPYSAFVAALTQLCTDVRSHELYSSRIRYNIVRAVQSDYKLLLDLIPNIGELVYEAGDRTSATEEEVRQPLDYNVVKSEQKFKFLLQRFFRAICQPDHKLVLALDDIQWIDPASLKLMKMLLSDASLDSALLLVVTYRDDEVDESHEAWKLIQSLQSEIKKDITSLIIGNLAPETVLEFVGDLLGEDPSRVKDLAKIVHGRVDGNAFFMIQFLTALRDTGLLTYNLGTTKWRWDEAEIRESTMVSSNVLAVLLKKIGSLSSDASHILKIGSGLGGSFSEDVITIVAEELSHSPPVKNTTFSKTDHVTETKRTCTETLEYLVKEGLLESFLGQGSHRSFCFAHSQIELAAYTLNDDSSDHQFELRIARILYANRSKFDYQGLLFTIVDLFNDGRGLISGDDDEVKLLIALNSEAGDKALESSAFGAASTYFRVAIDLIPGSERWSTYYDLCLRLYNRLIKAEYSNGKWDILREHIDKVLSQKNRPIFDKVTAYSTLITMLCVNEHKHLEAIDLSLDILNQLGVKFNKNSGKLGIVDGLIKTKLLLRKLPLKSLFEKGEMKDKNKLVALDILSYVNSSLYAANPDLHFCTILKTLRWSLKYGVSKDTAKCLSIYAVVEMAMGYAEAAKTTCQIAIDLAKNQNLMNTEYAPIAIGYGFVMPWSSSLHVCRNWMLTGYNIGVGTGDLHYGFMNIVMYCFFCFCTGKPLVDLEANMREYAHQMEEYNQSLQLQFLSLTWQTVLNLMGGSSDPVTLTGEVMDYTSMLKIADKESNAPLRAQVQCHRLQLAVYFRDYDLAAKLIGPASAVATVNPGSPIIWRNTLFEGVAAFEMVRRGRRKWRKTALKAVMKVKKWVDAGNVNCVHILYILQAEKAAMLHKPEESRMLFDKAITTAARNGFRNDNALANERCAEMCASVLKEGFWAGQYFQTAVQVYKEMEAFRKANDMMQHLSPYGRESQFESEGLGSSVLTGDGTRQISSVDLVATEPSIEVEP